MPGLSSQLITLADGDNPHPVWVGNNYSPITIAAADGTTSQTLVTGAPGYYITELGFQIDPNSTIAASGMVNLTFSDSSFGTIANFRIFIPQVANNPNIPTVIRQVNQGPFVWNNRTANSILSVHVNVALTGVGTIRAFVRYGLTNYLS